MIGKTDFIRSKSNPELQFCCLRAHELALDRSQPIFYSTHYFTLILSFTVLETSNLRMPTFALQIIRITNVILTEARPNFLLEPDELALTNEAPWKSEFRLALLLPGKNRIQLLHQFVLARLTIFREQSERDLQLHTLRLSFYIHARQ